jgi:hypothetical protein
MEVKTVEISEVIVEPSVEMVVCLVEIAERPVETASVLKMVVLPTVVSLVLESLTIVETRAEVVTGTATPTTEPDASVEEAEDPEAEEEELPAPTITPVAELDADEALDNWEERDERALVKDAETELAEESALVNEADAETADDETAAAQKVVSQAGPAGEAVALLRPAQFSLLQSRIPKENLSPDSPLQRHEVSVEEVQPIAVAWPNMLLTHVCTQSGREEMAVWATTTADRAAMVDGIMNFILNS